MTAPVEHLFRGGERIGPEDVPPTVLSLLRELAPADPNWGVTVYDGPSLYSLVVRDASEDSDPISVARDDVSR